ncbi:L-histidine N(alpha)-methyltransferase [Candidatus Kaiserbacteria bacterium]|nr:L-histidine N(alpha)-methyltransferase [Candidatus Kaiserbacteria bacterium]
MTTEPYTTFGPPYAVVNLSKLGLRYFRFILKVRPEVRDVLVAQLKTHPGVGWILSSEGWFNLGVGVWATSNAEIVDVSAAIRSLLGAGDTIVYQSELTSLYGFAKRPYEQDTVALPILDAMHASIELSPLELDYIKIVTMDNSHSSDELAELLGITSTEVGVLHMGLVSKGVIVGMQQRVNHIGVYHKVFVDTLSAIRAGAADDLLKRLWEDQACIYIERAVAKYDMEFEMILPPETDIREYLKDFKEYQTAVLTENLYTNLYPLSKVANFTEIKNAYSSQVGNIVDLRTSKLWYLNYRGTDAYLHIYDQKEYGEVMEQGEMTLFPDVAKYLNEKQSGVSYNLIDIGSGNGVKGRTFIECLGEQSVKAYYPVDIQSIELAAALRVHHDGAYAKHPTLLSFESLGTRFPLRLLPSERQVYVFFGGTYGNFPSSVINKYLLATLASTSVLLVAVPIVAQSQSDEEIIASYSNEQVENMAFGPLAQVGFTKDMFEDSPRVGGLKVHVAIEDERLVTSFVLSRTVMITGRSFDAGTVFKVTTSWKPTLEQFRAALEADFTVERMFTNQSMAIAVLARKD